MYDAAQIQRILDFVRIPKKSQGYHDFHVHQRASLQREGKDGDV